MALNKIYTSKYLQITIHVLFWGLIIVSPYFFRNPTSWKGFTVWHYRGMVNTVLLAAFFYVNAYYVYPILYKKKKQLLLYILVMIGMVVGIIALERYIDRTLLPMPERPAMMFNGGQRSSGRPAIQDGKAATFNNNKKFGPGVGDGRGPRGGEMRGPRGGGGFDGRLWGWYFSNLITYIFIIGISISYRIILDNAKQEKIRKEKENENLKTELSFLRSQVSPHFIFNILNNMVALARKKSDMLEPSLIELSKLMRYMLYENDDERVSLAREVEYLKSYIALQLLRFGDDVTIMFNPPEDINAYYLEPMLLAPFVENAFKHGVGMVEDPQINIVLNVDNTTGWLDFKVMNTIAPQQHTKDKSSGIGLANVRRRLELLYKEDYSLNIMQNDNIFIAELKIKLK